MKLNYFRLVRYQLEFGIKPMFATDWSILNLNLKIEIPFSYKIWKTTRVGSSSLYGCHSLTLKTLRAKRNHRTFPISTMLIFGL